jgi:hypothetical protein
MVIDEIVSPGSQDPAIVPILLSDAEESLRAIILFTVKPTINGITSIERMQYTKAPQSSPEEMIRKYSSDSQRSLVSAGIARSELQVIGPTEKELLNFAPKLSGYPIENDLIGIPVSKVMRVAVVGSAALACSSIAANLVMGVEAGYLQYSANSAVQERDALRKKFEQAFTARIRPLAQATSVDVRSAVNAASEVWHPNSLVDIVCTTSTCTVSLRAGVGPLDQVSADTAGQALDAVPDQSLIKEVLAQEPPKGYRKKEVTITGDGNEITVVFEQQKPDSPVHRLLPH